MSRANATRFAIAFVAAVLAIAAIVQPASAGTASVTPCTSPSQSILDILPDGYGSLFFIEASCPDITVAMNPIFGALSEGERGTAARVVDASLIGVDVTVSGGPAAESGIEVSLRVCSFDECGRKISATGSGIPSPEHLSTSDGIPTDPRTILLEAKCTKPTCDDLTPAVFSGLKLTYADDVDPVVSMVDPWGVPYGEMTPWSSDMFFYYRVQEHETFIDTLTTTVGIFPGVTSECERTDAGDFAYWCENYGFGLGLIQLPDDFEGSAPVTVSVTDAAGNPGSASVIVRRDTVTPPAPTDLTVGADDGGWIDKPEFNVQWSNTGESLESESESGIASADFLLIGDSGTGFGGTFTGAGINSFSLAVGAGGSYTLKVRLRDAAGNVSDYSDVSFKYDGIKPVAPGVSNFQTVNAAHSGGLEATWTNVTYWQPWFSGICGYRLSINSLEHDDPTTGDDVVELPADAVSYSIDEETVDDLPDGPRYFHLRAVSCAGKLGDTADRPILVDRTPPALATDPGTGGWVPAGGKLEISADDSDPNNPLTGISELSYRVGTEGDWTTVDGASVQVAIPQGMHTVFFTAVDLASNISESSIDVGVDGQIPSAAFDAFDPRDPTLVRGRVSDSDSGVDDAWIEFSPPGSSHWARLPGSSGGTGEVVVSARVPDDESLPPGDYGLRIVARDKAGNTSVVDSDASGGRVSVRLPLRPRPTLSLAVAARRSAKTTNSLTVPFGSTVEARGVLREANGNPVPNAAVTIAQSVSGGPRRHIATATTDAQGGYRAIIPAGPSRELTARFLGDASRGVASANATFNVRGKVTLKKLPGRVRSGRWMYFRGKVDPGSAALPKAGARIRIQRREGKHWSVLEINARTASDGSFETRWRYWAHGRARAFEFRAMVDTETSWPYAAGYSKSRKLVVR